MPYEFYDVYGKQGHWDDERAAFIGGTFSVSNIVADDLETVVREVHKKVDELVRIDKIVCRRLEKRWNGQLEEIES